MCCGQIAEDKEVYIITCFSVTDVIMLKKKIESRREANITSNPTAWHIVLRVLICLLVFSSKLIRDYPQISILFSC